MKVAQFNTFPYGGAATAAKRLHKTLRNNNIDSRFFFHRNQQDSVSDSSFAKISFMPRKYGLLSGAVKRRKDRLRQKEIYRLFNEHIAMRPPSAETFSMAELPTATHLEWSGIVADIIHVHWISFFADYESFFGSIPDSVPIVWTLHDMNAFTGGCHYSNNCTRFQYGCGGCPQVTNSGPKDVSFSTFNAKQNALANKQIHVATPSDWMRKLAMESQIWPENTTFQTIRLGFDLDVFRPLERSEARNRLGIKSDKTLIAFGAEDINNKRKGMHHLLGALANLKNSDNAECVVFGAGEIEADAALPYVHQFGYIDSEEQQALIYSAADIVVVPSREDNQPQVGLEAMACGTPVVAFDAGGIPEYVRDGQTGLLASLGDETQLAEKLDWLIDHANERREMGTNARRMMEQEFELTAQTAKYMRLYRSASAGNRSKRAA